MGCMAQPDDGPAVAQEKTGEASQKDDVGSQGAYGQGAYGQGTIGQAPVTQAPVTQAPVTQGGISQGGIPVGGLAVPAVTAVPAVGLGCAQVSFFPGIPFNGVGCILPFNGLGCTLGGFGGGFGGGW